MLSMSRMVWGAAACCVLPGVAVLAQAGAHESLPTAVPTAQMLASGKQTFDTYCSACHGPKGGGGAAPEGGKPAQDLTNAAFQDSRTDQQLYEVIHDGVPPDFFMEAWGDRLSEAEIRNVVHHLRSLRVAAGPAPSGEAAK